MAKTKEVKLTRRRMNVMYGACLDLERRNDPLSLEFSEALAFNMDAIELHIKAFERTARGDKAFHAYDDEYDKLVKEQAEKDSEGEPIRLKNGNYRLKDQYEFDKALEALRTRHPAYQKREDYLDSTVDVEFYTVNRIYVPEYIGLAYMRVFLCFIDREDPKMECPACGAQLYVENDQLREIKVPEPKTKPGKKKPSKKSKGHRKK